MIDNLCKVDESIAEIGNKLQINEKEENKHSLIFYGLS